MSPELSLALTGLRRLDGDTDVLAVVITGDGAVFSRAPTSRWSRQRRGRHQRAGGGFGGLVYRDFSKPVIAAVNGPAVAGGFEIVLSCDLVVAADTPRSDIPEVQRGLLAAAGGLIRLPARVPLATALEFAITGDPIDAPARARASASSTASSRRIRSSTKPSALAERIGANSPVAVRLSRQPGAGRRSTSARRRLAPHRTSCARSVRVRRLRRGRHRLRREADAGLEELTVGPAFRCPGADRTLGVIYS